MIAPPAAEWCDRHRGPVDEGRTRPLGPGSEFRICDGCLEEGLELEVIAPPVIPLLKVIADRRLPMDDRAGAYALLHQVQLRINRGLRAVRDEVLIHMTRSDLRELGPLSIKASAVGVAWPVNEPGNWVDLGIQDALAELAADRRTSQYVRRIPAHFELDTAALGAGVAEGNPDARRLHAQVKRSGWRVEEARRLSLEVRPTTWAAR